MLRRTFLRMLEGIRAAHLELRLRTARLTRSGEQQSDLHAVLEVRNERFFQRVLLGGDVGVGDAFVDGDWDTPDLISLVRLAARTASDWRAWKAP